MALFSRRKAPPLGNELEGAEDAVALLDERRANPCAFVCELRLRERNAGQSLHVSQVGSADRVSSLFRTPVRCSRNSHRISNTLA